MATNQPATLSRQASLQDVESLLADIETHLSLVLLLGLGDPETQAMPQKFLDVAREVARALLGGHSRQTVEAARERLLCLLKEYRIDE